MKFVIQSPGQVIYAALGNQNSRLTSAFKKSLREHFPYRRFVRSYEITSKFPGITLHDWLALDSYLYENPWVKVQLSSGAGVPTTKELILLSSVPRSGNTLIQKVINDVWGIPSTSAHSMDDIDFTLTPEILLLQVHQPYIKAMDKYYKNFDFKVINLYRHPFDILLSMLNFIRVDQQVIYWRDGAVFKNTDDFAGVTPTDELFVQWACSNSVLQVMNISHSWEGKPQTFSARYDEVINDLPVVIVRLAKFLGRNNTASREYINSLHNKKLPGIAAHHKWRGLNEGFYELLPSSVLKKLNRCYNNHLKQTGYDVMLSRAYSQQEAKNMWNKTTVHREQTRTTISPWTKKALKALNIQTTELDELEYNRRHKKPIDTVQQKQTPTSQPSKKIWSRLAYNLRNRMSQ